MSDHLWFREEDAKGEDDENDEAYVDPAARAIAEERREFYAKQTADYIQRLPQAIGAPDASIGGAHRERVRQRWFKASRTINIVHQTLHTLESFVLERGIGQLAQPAGELRARLVCFHTAGGHSMNFRRLAMELPKDGIDVRLVQLPGRMNRFNERPVTEVNEMVDMVLHDFDRLGLGEEVKTVLLGHGIGALVAFLCAHKCVRKYKRFTLAHFIVVGAKSPAALSAQNANIKVTKLHELPIRELLDTMIQLGVAPTPIQQRREVLQLLLPTFRADLKALECYQHRDIYGTLPCPITVLGGQDDRMASEAELRDWQECTATRPSVLVFPGHHYFFAMAENKDDFLQLVTNIMELAMRPDAPNTARSSAPGTARSMAQHTARSRSRTLSTHS